MGDRLRKSSHCRASIVILALCSEWLLSGSDFVQVIQAYYFLVLFMKLAELSETAIEKINRMLLAK